MSITPQRSVHEWHAEGADELEITVTSGYKEEKVLFCIDIQSLSLQGNELSFIIVSIESCDKGSNVGNGEICEMVNRLLGRLINETLI